MVSRAQRPRRRVAQRAHATGRGHGDAGALARRGGWLRPGRALSPKRHRRHARPRPARRRRRDRGAPLVSRLGAGAAPGSQRLHGPRRARPGRGRPRHGNRAPVRAPRGRRSGAGRGARRRRPRTLAEAAEAGPVAARRTRRAAPREGGRGRVPFGAGPEGGPGRAARRARAPLGGGGPAHPVRRRRGGPRRCVRHAPGCEGRAPAPDGSADERVGAGAPGGRRGRVGHVGRRRADGSHRGGGPHHRVDERRCVAAGLRLHAWIVWSQGIQGSRPRRRAAGGGGGGGRGRPCRRRRPDARAPRRGDRGPPGCRHRTPVARTSRRVGLAVGRSRGATRPVCD